MYTEFTLKLKALALAVMINALIMGGAAFLFDGQMHAATTAEFAHNAAAGINRVHDPIFRP